VLDGERPFLLASQSTGDTLVDVVTAHAPNVAVPVGKASGYLMENVTAREPTGVVGRVATAELAMSRAARRRGSEIRAEGCGLYPVERTRH
jgi:hypothetical protein